MLDCLSIVWLFSFVLLLAALALLVLLAAFMSFFLIFFVIVFLTLFAPAAILMVRFIQVKWTIFSRLRHLVAWIFLIERLLG